MIRGCAKPLVVATGAFFFAAGCISTKVGTDFKTPGLKYWMTELQNPRPNRVHVLRVELANQNIQPVVVVGDDPDGDGPAETALTDPFKLASDPSVVAFVNTNPWDSFPDDNGKKNRRWYAGQPVEILGMAATRSRVRSNDGKVKGWVWFDKKGRLFVGELPEEGSVGQAIAGFGQIVNDGEVIPGPSDVLHPRTAVGTNREGDVMWLVVVDGRQKNFSEGMSEHELAGIMVELGCWDATNMDGGGSSIMGMAGVDGQLRAVNRPPNIRPLPMILTIQQEAGKP